MTFLKNISYVVLGAGLGIATVFLARHFLTNSASNKKSKTNADKSTKIYVIPISPQTNKNEDDKKKEKKIEESGLLAQNQRNEEPIIDETVKAIIDGIVSIQNQTKELSEEIKEKTTDHEYSILHQISEEPISAEYTSENSGTFNPILVQYQNNAEMNERVKEKTVKETSGRKNTTVYFTPATQDIQREPESSLLIQNQRNRESTTPKSKNAVLDGIVSIGNQSEKPLENQEKEQKSTVSDYSVQHQNTKKLVNEENTIKNLPSINQTPDQIPNNAVLNGGEKTVKKIYVKNSIEETVAGVVLEQLGNDWNLKHQNIEESSVKSKSTSDIFVSLPSEEIANEELNSTVYKSLGDGKKSAPFKPPRIRKASKNDVFEGEKFSRSKFKNISLISSKKPSAQSTLLETHNKIIEVKRADDIKVLAEESNIFHNTFPTDNFLIEPRNKTLGHQLWRRYVTVFGNLFSWKKRAGDRSKLLDSSYSINNYGDKINSIDSIEDHEANLNKYKKFE